MPTDHEMRDHEARYGITLMGVTPSFTSTPPLLGDLVVVSWSDHVAAVQQAENRGYQQGIAEVIAWAQESAIDGPEHERQDDKCGGVT